MIQNIIKDLNMGEEVRHNSTNGFDYFYGFSDKGQFVIKIDSVKKTLLIELYKDSGFTTTQKTYLTYNELIETIKSIV